VADKKINIAADPSTAGKDIPKEPEQTLGQMIAQTRERKGLTPEQVVLGAHLPAHYVKMIETDNYGLISDELYVVPFLRKYATFLGLDAEEIASRFVRDVQHAESNVVRISQPLTIARKRSGSRWRNFAFLLVTLAVLLLLADYGWRIFNEMHTSSAPTAVVSPAAIAPAPATVSTVIANPAPTVAPPRTMVASPAIAADAPAQIAPIEKKSASTRRGRTASRPSAIPDSD
jgi:cytoskeleton protein RodZ